MSVQHVADQPDERAYQLRLPTDDHRFAVLRVATGHRVLDRQGRCWVGMIRDLAAALDLARLLEERPAYVVWFEVEAVR